MTTRHTTALERVLRVLLAAAPMSLMAGTLPVNGAVDAAVIAGGDAPPMVAARAAGNPDHHPVLVSKPPLLYPAIARQAHACGPVQVKVRVGTDGRVVEARATSGPFLLLFAAEDAIRSWRFKPALLDKQPVEATTYVTLNFTYSRQ